MFIEKRAIISSQTHAKKCTNYPKAKQVAVLPKYVLNVWLAWPLLGPLLAHTGEVFQCVPAPIPWGSHTNDSTGIGYIRLTPAIGFVRNPCFICSRFSLRLVDRWSPFVATVSRFLQAHSHAAHGQAISADVYISYMFYCPFIISSFVATSWVDLLVVSVLTLSLYSSLLFLIHQSMPGSRIHVTSEVGSQPVAIGVSRMLGIYLPGFFWSHMHARGICKACDAECLV